MVHVDGSLTTCCLDEGLENRIGNIREKPLRDLWYGKKMHAWRIAHIQGDFAASGPLCTRCNWQSAGSYPLDKAARYLEATSEDEILKKLQDAGRLPR
jgi:radical SAM protein with 4Fe4S-binding SPASM domain